MDEQWGYVGSKSRQRWLFYAYDKIRRCVVAHVFGERTITTSESLLNLLSPFVVIVWMNDGWPMYELRLKGKFHVISKRYTQRIERHNLNLRQHLARLGRKSLAFSKSVELPDKVIGLSHYKTLSINWNHYPQVVYIKTQYYLNACFLATTFLIIPGYFDSENIQHCCFPTTIGLAEYIISSSVLRDCHEDFWHTKC